MHYLTVKEHLHQLEMPQRCRIRLGLERVRAVAERLDLLQWPNTRVITVAGTNGKGSCVKVCEQLLLAAGYRVGAIASPHLWSFNERIRIQGELIDDKHLVAGFNAVAAADNQEHLTYFECVTLVSLWCLKQAGLDVVVLEVGMGGRLDAVNIVDADIAVITNVSFDHMQWLGKTRAAIGAEKAGIMRPGRPVVFGETDIPLTVRAHANRIGAELYVCGEDYQFQQRGDVWDFVSLHSQRLGLPVPACQLDSAAAAVMAVERLQGEQRLAESVYRRAMEAVRLPGRFTVISDGDCELVLDVAHNPAAMQRLAQSLQVRYPGRRCLAVVGMLADKQIAASLASLTQSFVAWYAGGLSCARGATGAQIGQELSGLGLSMPYYVYSNMHQALQAAREAAAPGDCIVVFGSFYTLAELEADIYNTHYEN